MTKNHIYPEELRARHLTKPIKKWFGSQPETCEVCNQPFKSCFYDARINHSGPHLRGKWALMCHSCFISVEGKLGLGWGQQYDLHSLNKIGG